MEIGAVALGHIAGPLGVAVAPARRRLVVDHRVDDVVIDRVGLGLRCPVSGRDAAGELADPRRKRDQLFLLQVTPQFFRGLVPARPDQVPGENLPPVNLEAHADLEPSGPGLVRREVVVRVAELFLPADAAGIRAVHLQAPYGLGRTVLGDRHPDLQPVEPRGNVLDGSDVGRLEASGGGNGPGRRGRGQKRGNCQERAGENHDFILSRHGTRSRTTSTYSESGCRVSQFDAVNPSPRRGPTRRPSPDNRSGPCR